MAKYKEYGYDIEDGVGIISERTIEIKESAFWCCENLTSIIIHSSVTKIWKCAFLGCTSLTEVRIPKGCRVDKDAFYNCPNVQIIRY